MRYSAVVLAAATVALAEELHTTVSITTRSESHCL